MTGRFTIALLFFTAAASICSAQGPAPAAATPTPGKVHLMVPIRDGSHLIKGYVEGGAPETDKVIVTVTLQGDLNKFAQREAAMMAVDGNFTATLTQPVVAGQEVAATLGTDEVTEKVQTAGDWGRVRAYFSGGAMFSKNRSDFSQQDLTVAFVLDKSWWQEEARGTPRHWLGVKGFNTFFDTRVTSVPVAGIMMTTPAGAPAAGSNGATPSATAQFIDSKKAAVMQAGFYIPFYNQAWVWTHDNKKNAIFIAPVGKIGLITATDSAPVTTSNNNGSEVTTTSTPSIDNSVAKFYALGVGLGHYELSSNQDVAHELISYLHLTVGKFENFDPGAWRIATEGRLKIPGTALQVGFDANVPVRRGPGDLRFVFGARFDIGELIGKLSLVNGQ
jgi:hypothetical protein